MPDKMKDSPNVITQLNALEEKKQTLARVIKIASSLEAMRLALTAVFQLGQPEADLPPGVLNFFTSLGKKVKNLSDLEIQTRLNNLQTNIKSKLAKVIAITAELDDLSDLNNQRIDEINQLVEDYKRHAQTAVALGILLQRRGVTTTPIGLSLTKETMLVELKRITTQENKKRQDAIQQTLEIRHDINVIRLNPNTCDATRQILDLIAENLKQNILHLRAGHSISQLPYEVEMIEFDKVDEQPALPAVEYEPENALLKTTEESVEPPPTETKESVAETVPTSVKNVTGLRGVWQRFNLWLNSPWSVNWKDLKKKPPKK